MYRFKQQCEETELKLFKYISGTSVSIMNIIKVHKYHIAKMST